MMKKKLTGVLMCALAFTLLTGCGGGGGSSAPEAKKPTIKVEAPLKTKVGAVDISSQKLAGYKFEAKTDKEIAGMTVYNGKLVYAAKQAKEIRAVKINGGIAELATDTFDKGILVHKDNNKALEVARVAADKNGYLYYDSSNKIYSYKDKKEQKAALGGQLAIAPDGKTAYAFFPQTYFEKGELKDGKFINAKESFLKQGEPKQGPLERIEDVKVGADGKVYALGVSSMQDMKYNAAIFSADGKQLALLGEDKDNQPNTISFPKGLAITDKYVCVMINGMPAGLGIWTQDGKFVGVAQAAAIFGKGYRAAAIGNWDKDSVIVAAQTDKDKKYTYEFFEISLK